MIKFLKLYHLVKLKGPRHDFKLMILTSLVSYVKYKMIGQNSNFISQVKSEIQLENLDLDIQIFQIVTIITLLTFYVFSVSVFILLF